MLACTLLPLLLTFAACVAATETPSTPIPASQCAAGNLQCCDAVQRADGSAAGAALAGVGLAVQDVEGLVGITCSPIDVLGIGQNGCHSQPVCCEDNDFHGIIAIGCVPVNINL